jgi:hypothetical protein
MKKIYSSIFFSLFSIFSVNAQLASLAWNRTIGSTGEDIGNAMVSDKAGNVFTIGHFAGNYTIPGSSVTVTSLGGTDVVLQKYNSEGQIQWAKTFGGTSFDEGIDIAIDSNGNIFVTGTFFGSVDFNPAPGTGSANVFTIAPSGLLDVFVSKFDNNGNFIWAKKIGGTSDDESGQLNVDEQGNVVTVGWFKGTVDFNPNSAVSNLTSAGAYDCFVQKLNNNGEFMWARRFGTNTDDYVNTVGIGVNNSIILGGTFKGTVDFNPGTAVFNQTSAGLFDAFLLSLSSDGNFNWAKRYGAENDDDVRDLVITPSKKIVVQGNYLGNVNFNSPNNAILNQVGWGQDIFILYLNSNGDFNWVKRLGGAAYDTGMKVGFDYEENIYACGVFQNTADFDPGPNVTNMTALGSGDSYYVKLNPLGDLIWARQLGKVSGAALFVRDVNIDNFGNVFSLGSFYGTCDFNPNNSQQLLGTSNGGADFYMHKMCQCETANSNLVTGDCNTSVNVNVFLKGYIASSTPSSVTMKPTLLNQSVSGARPIDCDVVTIELRSTTAPFTTMGTAQAKLNIFGQATGTLNVDLSGSFYIVVKHRNSVETWSAQPVTIMNRAITYNFTDQIAKAYAQNMSSLQNSNLFALHSGDITNDGVVDNNDFSTWETDANDFASGYLATDLDGDGSAENADFSIWELAANDFIGSIAP